MEWLEVQGINAVDEDASEGSIEVLELASGLEFLGMLKAVCF